MLKKKSIEAPDGVEVRAVESTDEVCYLVIPPHPKDGELTDEDLKAVADGATLPDERRKKSAELPGYKVD